KLIILPPNNAINKNAAVIKAYSFDGKLKFITGSLTEKFPLNLQGDFTDYYPNGNKKRLRHFEKGEELPGATLWYENGQLKLHRIPKGLGYYDETEYDTDGKLVRKLETNDEGRGTETLYYKNGAAKQIRTFLARRLEEKIAAYYPNGKPYFSKETSPGDDGPITTYVECRDSTGKLLTQKGKGYWTEYSDDFSYKALQ